MTSIGVNLAAVNYFGTEEPFVDRFKTSGDWVAIGANNTKVTDTLHFDANGYPIADANVTSLWVMVGVDPHDSAPNNEYVLTYSGTAKVSLTNATIVSSTPGKVVFDVKSESNGFSDVQVTFRNLSTGDPIHDIHMVRSDQVDLFNAGEIFNPDFVAKVSQWDVVRFMDWGATNNFDDVSWASRTQLTDRAWGDGQTTDGVPIEAMVKLANEAHVDMWYNVPTKADNNYVTQALSYIRDHLDSGLKVHVEYSNEMWNTGFDAYTYGQTQANTLWGVDANHNGVINASDINEAVGHGANIYYGYRSAQIASIAHTVFGADSGSRLVDVLAGQAAGSSLLASYILPGVAKAGVGSATSLFTDYAIAPYFGNELSQPTPGTGDHDTILGWARSGAAGLDAAFNELEFGGGVLSKNSNLAAVDGWFVKSQAAAVAAGLNLVAYEGGVSFTTTRYPTAEQAEVQAFFTKLLEDPRMGDLYTKMLDDFEAHGGTSFVAFNDAQKGGTSGNWGVLDDIYDDSSPRYDALLSEQRASIPLHAFGTNSDETIAAAKIGGAVQGLGGDDVIFAGAGNDTIDGGAGNDKILGSSGTMSGGGMIESDFYSGGGGSDTIYGGSGNDHIYGNSLETVAGTADGADILNGGSGNDYINGNAGADTIDGGLGNDRLYGGADGDKVLGSAGNDYLQGNKGGDTLMGGDGADTVHGGADNDQLNGDDGNDFLFGDAGNDSVTGGDGIDVMSGGIGNDTFIFGTGDAAFATTGGAAFATDEITDFTDGADHIALGFSVTQVLQGVAASAAAAYSFAVAQLGAYAGEHDVAAVRVGSDTYLFYDSAGAGGALDSAIKVDGVLATAFSAGDFV